MNLKNLISVILVCGLMALSGAVEAQQKTTGTPTPPPPTVSGPSSLKAAPKGQQRFEACCDSCPAGGCTGCNSGPSGLSCGSGLIKAKCQMVNNETTCVKDE